MSAQDDKLHHDLTFDQRPGEIRQLTPLIRRLVENNPGPFTFKGTCTYIVGRGEVAVIDPGAGDNDHLASILSGVEHERILCIVATHTHLDHSTGARQLHERTGAPIIGCAPYSPRGPSGAGLDSSHDRNYLPHRILEDGGVINGPGYTLTAVATPGHAANHLCLALEEERTLFSGDHVMAWSTSIVAPPDGSMSHYRASLEKLLLRDDQIYWPGHGGPVRQPRSYVRALINHRRKREQAILARLKAGDRTIAQMAAEIYPNLDPKLVHAASLSLLAHIEELLAQGAIYAEDDLRLEGRFRLA